MEEITLEPHLPPIIIGGGSLKIEMKHRCSYQPLANDPSLLNHKYVVRGEDYSFIRRVVVIREGEQIVCCSYDNLPDGCEVHIWLQKLKAVPASDIDYEPLTAIPQLRLKGTTANPRTNSELEIKSDEEFGNRAPTHKQHRPHNYFHRGYGGRHFRIGKWEIVDANGAVVTDGLNNFRESGDDGYRIALGFDHVQP